VKITFNMDGKDYVFDGDKLTVAEVRLLKTHLGLAPKDAEQWAELIVSGDSIDAVLLMMLFAKRRAGERVELADFDDLDAADLLTEFRAAMERALADLRKAKAAASKGNGKPKAKPRVRAEESR